MGWNSDSYASFAMDFRRAIPSDRRIGALRTKITRSSKSEPSGNVKQINDA
jgi:hypothetical protein